MGANSIQGVVKETENYNRERTETETNRKFKMEANLTQGVFRETETRKWVQT